MILTPLALPVFVSAIVYSALGTYSLRQRGVPAAAPFGIAILMAAGWAWTYALDLSSVDLSTKLLTVKPRLAFVAFLAVSWLAMALQHAGKGDWLTRRRLGAMLVVPTITSVLSIAIEQHHLLRYDFQLIEMGSVVLLTSKLGPWWWVHVGFSYTLIFSATAFLMASLRHATPLYRRQTWLIILASLLPALANVVFMAPFNPFPGFDMSTSTFMLTGGMVAWALFQHRFLDLAPVARKKVFEAMTDIVMVIDPRDRIVDVNPATDQILGKHYVRAVGQEVQAVFKGTPELVELCTGVVPADAEVYLRRGARQRCFHVHALPLTDSKGRSIGRLMTLRDATERVRAQSKAIEQERTRALLESQDRVARETAELLHGPVQTKLLIAWQRLSECRDLLKTDPEKAETLLEQVQGVLDNVREQEIRQASHKLHPAMISVGLVPAISSLVDDFQGTIRLDLEIDPKVRHLDDPSHNLIPGPVRLAAYHILEEALNNVYRHANATKVHISLCIDAEHHLAITAEDNGSGFDPDRSIRGLGLTVIGGRAEQTGGTWKVSSAIGRGTTVTAALPLDQGERAARS